MSKKHDIMWLKSIDSTNSEARRHISDIDNLSVLSALEQTSGRGQRGNSWSSQPGENLMFSIVLKFPCGDDAGNLPARDQFVLNEIASLSVVDFLAKYRIEAWIKWPNDIYVDRKKICGILVENSLRGDYISSSIVGIGLNINQRDFDVNLPNPTSMVLCQQERSTFDIYQCLDEFMDIFKSHFAGYEHGRTELRSAYISRLWRMNRTAGFIDYTSLPSGHLDNPINPVFASAENIVSGSREFTGRIVGLSTSGSLMVEDEESGQIRGFGFKEIGYII